MRTVSLRAYLLVLVAIPLLLLLLAETVVSYLVGMHTANQVFDRWLLDSAHSIAQEIRVDEDGLRFIAAADAVAMFEWDDIDHTYFEIRDADGHLIAGDLPQVIPANLSRLREGPVFETLRIDGELTRAVTLLNNPGADDEIVVQVAETLNKRRGMTTEVLSLVAMKKTLLIAGAMIAVAVAITRGMRPLRRLADELARRSPRDLTPLSEDDAPREVRTLIENTNGLLDRINHMLGAHESFVGNMAHQSRTPLAGIKLQAQLALRETDPAAVRRALAQIARAADHMTHVNSQLLKLARAEIAFDRGPQAAPTDLVALVEACCDEFGSAARARDITLLAEMPEEAIDIEGDPALLHEMLRNLVENAIVYGSRHGHVWIRVEGEAHAPRLVVEDDGRGIPPEHRPQIFDHFYRPPNSPGEGCGLGLPIVREIARAHGGDVRLEDRATGPGIRFVVEFPPRPARGPSAAETSQLPGPAAGPRFAVDGQ